MSLQNAPATRRQFLERSMLGFGSAFLLPSLLQSCMTDHNIPPVGIEPPLFAPQIDWNDAAKTAVSTVVSMVPEAGEILGPLVDIFWPSSGEDVWGQIKDQVEALVDQKIADSVYLDVSNDLTGLYRLISSYQNELQNGTPEEMLIKWISVSDFFTVSLPHFQSKGYELLLLPFFGQFANLHLAVLLDGFNNGPVWGKTYADTVQDYANLQQAISDYSIYAGNTWYTGRANLASKTKRDDHNCEPFRTLNKYDRQLFQTVFYFYDIWPYFDQIKYPPYETKRVYDREIYSDPFGTCDDSGNIYDRLITTPGTQLPINITVKAWDRIQSLAVTYPANSGPGGATTISGGAFGGDTHSITILPNNPIYAARVGSGDIVNALQLQYHDGTTTEQIASGGGDSGWVGYPYMALSSIHINGVSNYYDCADSVVFGFQSWTPPAATLNAIRSIYVTSPKERSVADFANKFPKHAIPADLVTDELKAKRRAYWESIKARAK